MGRLLPTYKKALFDELVDSIALENSYYYAFASNPIPYVSDPPEIANNDYQQYFVNNWQLLFGKKLAPSNFAAIIDNNEWSSNTVYRRYDNTDVDLYSNNLFYVITTPDYVGGSYNVYKCIDNANDSPSLVKPNQIQYTTFETADGYKWRYLTSLSYLQYKNFSSDNFSPIFSNNIISVYSNQYAGVDVVMISNGGVGYSTYHEGTVQSANATVIQIETANTSGQNDFYNNSAIYIYNSTATTGQIFGISQYVSNTSGKWVYLDGQANTDNILPSFTQYKISPRVVFNSDGDISPVAYSVVNTVTNSISNVVILNPGSGVTWCNVHITSTFGSGSNLYAIVPPSGGHGYDVVSELNVKGFAVNFNFSNNEGNTIYTSNVVYNKIGLVKNPFSLNSNNTIGNTFTGNTFNQLLKANTATPVTFANGDYVVGNTSGCIGTVVFSNTTYLYLTGDTGFSNGEYVTSSNGSISTQIFIETLGDLYIKNQKPLYVQNINNINRSDNQKETFKLIIQF